MFICMSYKFKNYFFFKRFKLNVYNKVVILYRLDNDN